MTCPTRYVSLPPQSRVCKLCSQVTLRNSAPKTRQSVATDCVQSYGIRVGMGAAPGSSNSLAGNNAQRKGCC